MKIYVCQIYIEPGVSYPFTHVFQKYLSNLVSEDTSGTEQFREKYGDDYDLVFNVSAKTGLNTPDVKGPTVFKREKTVEYTVFLPFDRAISLNDDSLSNAIRLLLKSMNAVLFELGMTTNRVANDPNGIAKIVVEDQKMTAVS
jgi:hypothetical protein